MALLWKNAAAHQVEAMSWHDGAGLSREEAQPISVREAGFKGYVGGGYGDEDFGDEDHHGGFDEDAYDEATPEPTHEEEAHHAEHGEYPESFHDRHDRAYSDAMDAKARENEPDHEDEELHTFVAHHGANTPLWQSKGHLGKVDISQGVWATQSHVSKRIMDEHEHDPSSGSWQHRQEREKGRQRSPHDDYLGHDTPMFVTHEGRLHATEGHHRVAVALKRGEQHVFGWHYDGDKHGLPGSDDED